MSINTIDTAVARLEVQVERLEADMSELKQDVKAIRMQLDTAAGGWRAFLLIGSGCAAIGAIVARVFWR